MRKAFTVLELMIVTVLMTMLVAVVTLAFVTCLKAWSAGLERTGIRADGSLAMERMVRDLSQAGNITIATESAITFSADMDGDGTDETISLTRNESDNLIRTVDFFSAILAPNVETLNFTYLDSNNNPLTPVAQEDRDDISVITIALTMNKAGATYQLSSSVFTRNQVHE